jgi:N-acetyl-anhydromuramyl-L-alanine amidase AmpD
VGGVEEPGYNDLAPIGGGTSSSSSARPAVKSKPSSGTTTNNQMPEMLGPNAGIAAPRRAGRSSATLLGAAPSTPVVRTSLNEQIRPYLDAAGTNDLLYPDRADRPWRYIILHHSAATSGNYSQIDKEHRQVLGIEGCGYHFVIGNGNGSEDGKIEVAQRWVNQKQGVHCRNAKSHDMDEYGVGVCLIGDIDQDPPTPKQIAATQALVAYLSDRYRIKRDNVSTHTHIATTPTVCPGKYFPQESSFTGKKSASTTTPARATSAMLYRHGY